MSVLFSLAADFIDKVTNPSYGPLVNEEYSLKLGQLVNDESFLGMFSNEIKRIENVDELTPHAWIWVLRWCRTNRIKPSDAVLTALIKKWSSVFLQVLIIDAATFDASENEFNSYEPRVLKNEWLIDTISQLTVMLNPDEKFDDTKEQLDSPKQQPLFN